MSKKHYDMIQEYTSEKYSNQYSPKTITIDFKDFVNNPVDNIEKIQNAFGFPIIQSDKDIKLVEEFIEPKLRRSRVD